MIIWFPHDELGFMHPIGKIEDVQLGKSIQNYWLRQSKAPETFRPAVLTPGNRPVSNKVSPLRECGYLHDVSRGARSGRTLQERFNSCNAYDL